MSTFSLPSESDADLYETIKSKVVASPAGKLTSDKVKNFVNRSLVSMLTHSTFGLLAETCQLDDILDVKAKIKFRREIRDKHDVAFGWLYCQEIVDSTKFNSS